MRALRIVTIGCALVILDARFATPFGSADLLPDLPGWAFTAYGLHLLARRHPLFKVARVLAILGVAVEVFLLIPGLRSIPGLTVLSLLSFIAVLAFVCLAVAALRPRERAWGRALAAAIVVIGLLTIPACGQVLLVDPLALGYRGGPFWSIGTAVLLLLGIGYTVTLGAFLLRASGRGPRPPALPVRDGVGRELLGRVQASDKRAIVAAARWTAPKGTSGTISSKKS